MSTPRIYSVHACKGCSHHKPIKGLILHLVDSGTFCIYIALNLILGSSMLNSEMLWSKFININANYNR